MVSITTGGKIYIIITNIFLFLVALIMILPLINVAAVSFTTDIESYENVIKLFPREPSIVGYKVLFERIAFFIPLTNNAIVAVVGTFFHVLFCSMAGYVLLSEKLPGKTLLFVLVLIPMMIPFQFIMIPFYVTMKKLGLIDTLSSLIITDIVTTFSILLIRNYFQQVPRSLAEAARMDGASDFTIFFRVYLPLAVPGLVTISIFEFVLRWNQFLPAVLFINSPEKYTLQIALRSLIVSQELAGTAQSNVANNTRMAGIIVSIIPLIIIYLLFQKYFKKGIVLGAVKE